MGKYTDLCRQIKKGESEIPAEGGTYELNELSPCNGGERMPPQSAADAWGDLASVVRWFLAATPPAEPFKLRQGITIRDPIKFWRSLREDIEAGPGTRRDHYGGVVADLTRLWEMFSPRAVTTMEQ